MIDTAPTGHTLRLLATPAIFDTFARVLDLIQEKHRVLAAAFGRGVRRDKSEALIEQAPWSSPRKAASRACDVIDPMLGTLQPVR